MPDWSPAPPTALQAWADRRRRLLHLAGPAAAPDPKTTMDATPEPVRDIRDTTRSPQWKTPTPTT